MCIPSENQIIIFSLRTVQTVLLLKSERCHTRHEEEKEEIVFDF